MKRNNKNAFTLVELLAVIVILAIILVIAVPKVMSIIGDAKKGTLESIAKMIASAAEKAKVQNTVLGNTEEITCESVTKLNNVDYESCKITFEGNTAKVTIKGKGKFACLNVCGGTKIGAEASEEECPIKTVSFKDDDWETIVAAVQSGNHPYQVGNTKTIEMDIDNNGEVETYTIRVSNTTKCSELETEPLSKTACGFVLEFADIIKEQAMSSNKGNNGGWPASEMYDFVNIDIYEAMPYDLRNGIMKTKVISSYGSDDTSNFESEDYLYLLSEQEVYGTSFIDEYDTSNGTSRQLDYYVNNNVSTLDYDGAVKKYGENNPYRWWLRSAYSNDYYSSLYVGIDGHLDCYFVYSSYGVSPAFRLAN